MTIDGVYNNLNSMMSIQSRDADRERTPDGTGVDLARLTDSISLSSIDPKLRAVLEDISVRGGNVVDALEGNINALQEGFVETLHTRLSGAGVSLDDKITLRLGSDDALQLVGNHPDRARIEEVISSSPDLKEAFQEIAGQSELVRDIRNIRKVVGTRGGVAQYEQMAQENSGSADAYQLSMRGSFSHFYFSPEG